MLLHIRRQKIKAIGFINPEAGKSILRKVKRNFDGLMGGIESENCRFRENFFGSVFLGFTHAGLSYVLSVVQRVSLNPIRKKKKQGEEDRNKYGCLSHGVFSHRSFLFPQRCLSLFGGTNSICALRTQFEVSDQSE